MSGWLDKDASDAKVQVPHHSSRCDTLHTSSVINTTKKTHVQVHKSPVYLGEHIGSGIGPTQCLEQSNFM